MAFLILYIAVTITLSLFFGYPGYLVWVILFTLPFWLPNSGDIITDTKGWGEKYKYAQGYDNSNPLYVRGCLRKKKKSFVFGSVKGLFVCQMIALVMIVFAWIYLVASSIYGKIVLIEKILVYICVLLMFIWEGLKLYYQKCCDWSYRYTENAEGVWMPFHFLFQKYTGSLYNNSFFAVIMFPMKK